MQSVAQDYQLLEGLGASAYYIDDILFNNNDFIGHCCIFILYIKVIPNSSVLDLVNPLHTPLWQSDYTLKKEL